MSPPPLSCHFDAMPPRLPSFFAVFIALCGSFLLAGVARAHPVPDVPVRAAFEADGSAVIQVEIDPRSFSEDPLNEPYLQNWVLEEMTAAERAELTAQAAALIANTVEFQFEPLGQIVPKFTFAFTTHGGEPLKKIDDPVMLLGTWRTTLPEGLQGYRIRALPAGNLSVLFLNKIRGTQVKRMQVLFPGEDSYILDLTGLTASMPTDPLPGSVGIESGAAVWWANFRDFLREGFVHVVPRGLDHILFVLGVFLLSRKWRPLLWQVTTFTVAHTLTLALATLELVRVPGSVVEPVIAASIAVVALENIFHPKYTRWRLLVVFIFGLVHGLGFAGALRELDLPPASLVVGLLGFNVGVECGQLTVIAIAFLATAWLRDPDLYRRAVVIPGSLLIAAAGVWWTITRIAGM